MSGSLQVLDCTLRDGGLGLEYIEETGHKIDYFTEEEKAQVIGLIQKSGIDILEIGGMRKSKKSIDKFAIYENIEQLSRYLPKKHDADQIFAGIYLDPDTDLREIPDYSPEFVEGIRVILRYSQLQQSIDFCTALSEKGYRVFIQPMVTMRYTDDELKRLVYAANEMKAYALYLVDSFGYMDERDIDRLYHFYAEDLDASVKIGFHAHNNMENAPGNMKYFVECLSDRDRIIDSCVMGMGQGAGNLQTEILINFLNTNYGTAYDMNCVLEVCEILDKFRKHDAETWGYSILRTIPAIHKAAYKYAFAMREEYGMSFAQINMALTDIPDELRHRYTPDNLKVLLKAKGMN